LIDPDPEACFLILYQKYNYWLDFHAQRLNKVLEKIVNNDQTGYIKNRFIGFNHRQIQDIIDFAESYNVEGAIVFVDFKT
jgi:hypothetical protein